MRNRSRALASVVALCVLVSVLAVVPRSSATSPATRRVIVLFRPGVPDGLQRLSLAVAGLSNADVVHRLPQIDQVVVAATDGERRRLAGNPLVSRADADVRIELTAVPSDPEYPTMQGLADIRAEEAWDTYPGAGGFSPSGPYTGAPIAVIDSGIDDTHQEFAPFADKVPICKSYGANIIFDPIDCTNHPSDTIAHGTHVAGTAAANADDGLGIPGVSPTSPLYVYKACQKKDCWLGDVEAGLVDATDDGAAVANLSLSGPIALPQWQSAVSYAVRKDVVVVAAAGNGGNGASHYPASFNGVISTAALVTGTGDRASFSQYNSDIDLAAPGTGILSSVAPEANGGVPNGYLNYNGTSMATPHVAGAAALVRSVHPDWSAGKVRGALLNTAIDVGSPGTDKQTGRGRVDAAAAVSYDPVDDADDDDDGVVDTWDADPDDPTSWDIWQMSGSVNRSGASVSASWIDLFGFFTFGFVTINAPGRVFFDILTGGKDAGTSATGVTLFGTGFQFGTKGIGSRSYRLKLVDDPDGDQLRVEIGGQLITDGPSSGGGLTIRGT